MDFVYDLTIDPDAGNNTHAFALGMIGHNKRDLEVGCATGYFTKVLAERGCKVVGMELDPEAATVAGNWAERVVVGSVDEEGPWDLVDDESFDVITFGDVLEHLQDPLAVLRAAVHKLKPSGFIVTSLPNIAHGDVRLSLLHGAFQYTDLGLLDRTHIRFFTLQTIRELLRDAGLVVVETERVIMPLFCSELGVKRDDYAYEVLEEVRADAEYETYQFVMKSVIDNGSHAVADMANRLDVVSDALHEAELRKRFADEQLTGYADIKREFSEIAEERDRLMGQVETLSGSIEELTRQMDQLQVELTRQMDQLQVELTAMTARADEHWSAAHAFNIALQESERQLNNLRNSRSFRLTAQLRRLRFVFHGSGET